LQFPFFDFNNPTVVQIPSGTLVGTINSTGVEAYPNGWYRVSITFTTAATPINVQAGVYIATSNGTLPAASTAGLNAYIWGIQAELGAFPTSYIPTTSAALTRSADVCSVTTTGWSNAGNDTMVAEYFVRQHISNAIILEGGPLISWLTLSASATSLVNRILYRHGGTATRFDANPTENYSLANINKLALTSGEQLCLNGSLGQTVLSDPGQLDISTILSIGRRSDFGGANYLNGHIAAVRYFRKRLPNAKLQALTT
jgi:hypothetical protein